MMKKLLAMVGLGGGAGGAASATKFYTPYAESHVNTLYNLLFCDDIALFCTDGSARAIGPWPTLFAEKLDATALSSLAADERAESRIRALAYNRLRAAGHTVPARKLLGVIVEVPLDGGRDVLAAYADGRVRYLNQSGKVAIFETGNDGAVDALAKELVSLAQPLVEQIGPWDKNRLPPPRATNVRLTFLVSDGLYFGEGSFEAMSKDPMGGPVLAKATQLLQLVVKTAE